MAARFVGQGIRTSIRFQRVVKTPLWNLSPHFLTPGERPEFSSPDVTPFYHSKNETGFLAYAEFTLEIRIIKPEQSESSFVS